MKVSVKMPHGYQPRFSARMLLTIGLAAGICALLAAWDMAYDYHEPRYDFDGSHRIVSYRAAGEFPTVAGVSMFKDELTTPWKRRLAMYCCGAGLLLVLALLLSANLRRYVVGAARIGEDVTEHEAVRLELRESRRILETLMTNLSGMAYRCLHDEMRTLVFVSEGCRELTGYASDALVANRTVSFGGIIDVRDRRQVADAIKDAVRLGEQFHVMYRIGTASGEERWVLEKGTGVYSQTGKLVALEGFVTDITERKRLEEQLQQTQKMELLSTFAGGIAHDFNNILTIIISTASLIELRLGNGDPLRKLIRNILDASNHASVLTKGLLSFSRKQAIDPRMTDLNTIVKNVGSFLMRLIGEKITLEMSLTERQLPVYVDTFQIEQVLMNLAANARDAMPHGGRIRITTEFGETFNGVESAAGTRLGRYAALIFADNGSGMGADTKKRIFEPFFTTKAVGNGTGLGLAMARAIVEQYQGTITVASAPEQGTSFTIRFPLQVRDEERPEPDGIHSGATTKTIRVVENDAAGRKIVGKLL